MTAPKDEKMTRSQIAVALQNKTQEADRASNFLQGMLAQFNYANDAAVKRMADMTLATRVGRGKDEPDRD